MCISSPELIAFYSVPREGKVEVPVLCVGTMTYAELAHTAQGKLQAHKTTPGGICSSEIEFKEITTIDGHGRASRGSVGVGQTIAAYPAECRLMPSRIN